VEQTIESVLPANTPLAVERRDASRLGKGRLLE
jgi:hypothetical protein